MNFSFLLWSLWPECLRCEDLRWVYQSSTSWPGQNVTVSLCLSYQHTAILVMLETVVFFFSVCSVLYVRLSCLCASRDWHSHPHTHTSIRAYTPMIVTRIRQWFPPNPTSPSIRTHQAKIFIKAVRRPIRILVNYEYIYYISFPDLWQLCSDLLSLIKMSSLHFNHIWVILFDPDFC